MTTSRGEGIRRSDGPGEDDPRTNLAVGAGPELESVLVDWYRTRLGCITGLIDPSRDSHALEMQAVIEDSLDLGRRPPDESRRWLDQAHRSSAEHAAVVPDVLRSGLIRCGRRTVRTFIGKVPQPARADVTRTAPRNRLDPFVLLFFTAFRPRFFHSIPQPFNRLTYNTK